MQVSVIYSSETNSTGESFSVQSCNDGAGKIEMVASIRNPRGRIPAGFVQVDKREHQKVYQFADMEQEFVNEIGKDWMKLSATVGFTECEEFTVDGQVLCKDYAREYTFVCRYELGDHDVANSFVVSGQDKLVAAEGTGELLYTLEGESRKILAKTKLFPVDESVAIGKAVNLRIVPVNPGVVFATVKSCDVIFNNVHVTIFGHKVDKCLTTVLGSSWQTYYASSTETIRGRNG